MWWQYLPGFLFLPKDETTLGFSAVNPFLKDTGKETVSGENRELLWFLTDYLSPWDEWGFELKSLLSVTYYM